MQPGVLEKFTLRSHASPRHPPGFSFREWIMMFPHIKTIPFHHPPEIFRICPIRCCSWVSFVRIFALFPLVVSNREVSCRFPRWHQSLVVTPSPCSAFPGVSFRGVPCSAYPSGFTKGVPSRLFLVFWMRDHRMGRIINPTKFPHRRMP